MSLRIKLAGFAFTLLLPVAAYSQEVEPEVEHFFAPAEVITIGVMEFKGVGLPQEMADVIADVIADHINKLGDVRVVSKADITALLNLEKQRRLAGCSDKECFAEVAGALGMPWMVTGNVSILGKSAILNLKLIDVRSAYVAGRTTRRIRGDVDDLLEALPGAVEALFEKVGDRFGFALSADEVKSASKHRQSIFWSPSSISVYTRNEILASGAPTIADFLRRVPGLDVYELKPSYTLVGARALTDVSNNLVLVLVDGREEIVELSGVTLLSSLCIDYREIERIEVIRGPGSALYGANAFAAIVSITTVADQPANRGEVYLSAGEDYHRLSARASGRFEPGGGELSFGASAGLIKTITPSDRYHNALDLPYRAHGYLRYLRGAHLDLSLHAGILVGSGAFYTIMVGDLILEDAQNYFVMGQAKLSLSQAVRLKVQLYLNEHDAVFKPRIGFRTRDIWVADSPDYPLRSPTVDGQVQLDIHILDSLMAVTGANLRYVYLHAENYEPRDLDDLRGAGFFQANWAITDTLQLTGGVRLDLSTEIEPAVSHREALVYRPGPANAFRLSYGLAFRKPCLYETQVHVPITDYNSAFPEVVDKFLKQLGNEGLTNEKVHSFEAGWQGIFLEERLRLSLNLFFNIYHDVITFEVDIPLRMGLPDIENSTLTYMNADGSIYALGGEAEASYRPAADWHLWCNLGIREARESGRHRREEPRFKANLGGSFGSVRGPHADLALHYVSEYQMPHTSPRNLLDNPVYFSLGNTLLLIARLGYRIELGELRWLDAGLTVRTPLGSPFREFPGEPIPASLHPYKNSDFGGERLVRLVAFYLSGSF
jgi:outer membrane cobalamin receptor